LADAPGGAQRQRLKRHELKNRSLWRSDMEHENSKQRTRNESRRTALKTLMAGGGFVTLSALPARWAKPVVDAVMLPAHAQTSSARNGILLNAQQGRLEPSWWKRIVPSAYAGETVVSSFLCIESTGEGTFAASLSSSHGTVTASGDIGDCETLLCASKPFAGLRVTAKNEDGSFDFTLYDFPDCSGLGAITDTTNTPCDVQPNSCVP
jgi:hypothetical protein